METSVDNSVDTSVETHYEIQATVGTWSAPISESDLFDFLRKGIVGLDAHIREVETGKILVVRDYPLLAALLRSLSNEPTNPQYSPMASTTTVPEGDSRIHQSNQAEMPRLRGCPNCKRMVSTQAAQCPACGHVFRAVFDDPGSLARPSLEQPSTSLRENGGSTRMGASLPYSSGNSASSGGAYKPPTPSSAIRGTNVSAPFDPYAGLGDRDKLILGEFGRQYSQFMWWAILGLVFGASIFSLLLTLYGIIRMHTIRQNVAELGVDPGLWNAYESKRFWNANKPSLAVWVFVILGFVAACAIVASDIANSTARSPVIYQTNNPAGASAER